MKKSKLSTLLCGICLVSMLVTLLFMGACAKKPAPTSVPKPAPTPKPGAIEIKAVTYSPIEREKNFGYRLLIDTFNKEAKGEAIIKFLGGTEVIPASQQVDAVIKGVIDMSNVFGSNYLKLIPELDAYTLSRLSIKEEREKGLYDYMKEKFNKVGVFHLGRCSSFSEMYIYLTKIKPTKWQDLKGLRMAQTPGFIPAFKALGVVGVDVADAELYTALQQGLIAGSDDIIASVLDYSLFEVLKYWIEPGYGKHGSVIANINLNTWNRLPQNMRDLMLNIQTKVVEPQMVAFLTDLDMKIKKQLKEKGMEVIRFSPENSAEFENLMYDAGWGRPKGVISPEDYLKLRKLSGN